MDSSRTLVLILFIPLTLQILLPLLLLAGFTIIRIIKLLFSCFYGKVELSHSSSKDDGLHLERA